MQPINEMQALLKPETLTWLSEMGLKVLAALIILVLGLVLSRWAERSVSRGMQRTKVDMTLTKFFSRVASWGIITLTVVTVLGYFGVQTATFAAVLASLSFAIGLSLQGSLSNFASGVMLLVLRPFKVGDYVSVAGQQGTVCQIDLFATTLDTPDNRRINVPNGAVFGSTIENVSYHDMRRCDIAVGVDYTADLDETREILTRVVDSLENKAPDKEAQVVLTGLGASSVDWAVRIWCHKADFWPLKEKALRAIKYALDEARIGIPFPQMDVHVRALPTEAQVSGKAAAKNGEALHS